MKYFFYIFILILVITCSAYLSREWTLSHLPKQDNTDLIEANTKLQSAQNSLDLREGEIEARDSLVADLQQQLLEQHLDNNWQEPPKTDEDIPQADVYFEFLSDPFLEVNPVVEYIYKAEDRIAKTEYSFMDRVNKYSLDLSIKYIYKTHEFEITPSNRTFESEKVYSYAVNIFARPDEIGLRLDGDWRFIRVSGGIGNKLEPELSLGIRF